MAKRDKLGRIMELKLDEEKIRGLYINQRKSVKEIARIFGVSKTPIVDRLKKLQIRIKKSHEFRMIDLDLDKIRDLYLNKNLSSIKISKILGVCKYTILKRLKEMNIKRRSNKIVLDNKKIIDLYITQGKSIIDIGKILGVSETTIYNRLKENNIRIKSLSESNKGKHNSSATEFKKGLIPNLKGKTYEDYFGEEKAKEIKNKIFSDKNRTSMLKGLIKKPNKPEKVMINLIKENNLPFNYVGDGQVIIGGKCPDFLSKNPKRIIEVFGEVFHDPSKTFKKSIPYHQTKKGTIEHYAKYGFQTLVIWVNELENPNQVLNKIQNFLK